jgi:nicotinamide mononucleotide transporter
MEINNITEFIYLTPVLNSSLDEFFATFWQNILDTSLLEFAAVIFGILSVWFAKKENIWVYPTGIISVLIYVYILALPSVQLYADAGINFFYFLMSVYGWVQWTRKDEKKETRDIGMSNKKDWLLSGLTFILSLIVIVFLLRWFKADDANYWSTNLPYIDSFTTAIFIVAMLLMAFKKTEHWIFWIIGNIISIPLYMYKGLLFTGVQFIVFLILAVMGYAEWKRKYKQMQTEELKQLQ